MPLPTNPVDGQTAIVNNINYTYDSTSGTWTRQSGSAYQAGELTVYGDIIPSANVTYNLGSSTNRFQSLYLSGNTINLGGTSIKVDSSGNIAFIPESGTGFIITNAGTTNTLTAPVWSSGAIIPTAGNVFFSNILVANSNSSLIYTITSGNTLQANLSLATTGNLSGNVTAGSYSFSVDATDTFGQQTSRSFTVTASDTLTIDYLAVAGGGGNAANQGLNREAGSGAGGLLQASSVILTAGSTYSVVVGAGGSGHSNGSNTTFLDATCIGGGSGGNEDGPGGAGAPGGSGGGGWYNNAAGAGTPGQGYPGNTSGGANSWTGGGGGGAGSAGSVGTGGSGVASNISGSSVTYAAGGAGNTYSGTIVNASGSSNTGNGASGIGGGGSGVVIIRYPGSQRSTGGIVTSSGGYTVHTFTSSGTFAV